MQPSQYPETVGASYLNTAMLPNMAKFGLALVPFTPVPFTGNGALFAWGRLVLYGGVSALLFKRNRPLSVGFGIAAATCLATSLAAKTWESPA